MTPAINEAKKQKIPFTIHQYQHDPNHPSFGMEAAEALQLEPARVFKTLVIQLDNGKLAVAVLPVSEMLNLKRAAAACGTKKAELADKAVAEKSTGYVLGGISPLGQKKRLSTLIDKTATDHHTIYVSGGRRGLDIELRPADLQRLTNGQFAELT
ncbi:Cys-tRNA(Pro) deacylase [Desulfofustis limnaeus]|jgi:Cys-tRNA(Pro)/Cys-tRNA(Cys) deacylase|uniref:Cys-tRNA(Pro)/Cys-tRNA(Cys) deacylase n=1 Tax=Desulfofustis limnaeus TaxID=2740163 RepID=A0ABM7WBL5_9BACT|nr:Cys-tRNA(Pro) deacylase [Desulfofustis limnaeus]MDX9895360.1 Cys-tRNA(Pro) deacylase [Desulfofustis sp.]BDD88289.1 Cys-tRNA(Pro)/Cys-tRNA(Cys) deacylase [Desulfofustis limnaeus]